MTQLAPNRCQLALNGIRFNVFRVRPEDKTPTEMFEVEGFWAHVSHQFRPGDRLEVLPDDYSYLAEYMVIDAGKLYAKVKQVNYTDFSGKIDVPAGYEVRHRGPKGWCVLRGKDVLAEQLGTAAKAQAWLDEHLNKAA